MSKTITLSNDFDPESLIELLKNSEPVAGYSDKRFSIRKVKIASEDKSILEDLQKSEIKVEDLDEGAPKKGEEFYVLASGERGLNVLTIPGRLIKSAGKWNIFLVQEYDWRTQKGLVHLFKGYELNHGLETLWQMRNLSCYGCQEPGPVEFALPHAANVVLKN